MDDFERSGRATEHHKEGIQTTNEVGFLIEGEE